MLIAVIGPGGVGKNCLVDKMEENGYAEFIPVDTTRPIRPGEIPGKTYNYLTDEELDRNIIDNKYFEIAEFKTISPDGEDLLWRYAQSEEATHRAAMSPGKKVSIQTPKGGLALKEARIPHISVLITASRPEIEHRMINVGKREIKEAIRRIDADEKDFKGVSADIVINTDGMSPDEVYEIATSAIPLFSS